MGWGEGREEAVEGQEMVGCRGNWKGDGGQEAPMAMAPNLGRV